MPREFFSTLVRMEFRSHDFDDEPKKGLFNFIFCGTLKVFHFGSDFRFFALLQYLVLYAQIWNN